MHTPPQPELNLLRRSDDYNMFCHFEAKLKEETYVCDAMDLGKGNTGKRQPIPGSVECPVQIPGPE